MTADTASFYRISAVITGYSEAELHGTGVGEAYYATLYRWIRQDVLTRFFALCDRILNLPQTQWDEALRQQVFASQEFGPIARNLIKLWYLSNWYPLEPEWNQRFGVPAYRAPVVGEAEPPLQSYVVSNNAYIQGLAWRALGSHAMGAQQPGYASWAEEPKT